MSKDNTKTVVAQRPLCDICNDGHTTARYDGKTSMGPWANMCQEHFVLHGIGLGLGRGQELVLADD